MLLRSALECSNSTQHITILLHIMLGEMVLNSATKVFSLPDKKGKPLYQFVVTCGASGKVFKISATDQRENSEWLYAIKEAIAIGRVKNTSSGEGDDNNIDYNDDMCEMAAHYKVKYGLEGLEKSLTIASKRFSKVINYHEDSRSPSTERSITSSLSNLLSDNLDESKNDDVYDDNDNGDEISYMVMHPAKKGIQHTLSLDRIDLKAAPSHKPLTYSTSSAGSFICSDSVSSYLLSNSIRTPNGYRYSPGSFGERTFSGNKNVIRQYIKILMMFSMKTKKMMNITYLVHQKLQLVETHHQLISMMITIILNTTT